MIREGYYRAGEGYRSTDERGYNAGLIIARDFDRQMLTAGRRRVFIVERAGRRE